MKTPRILAFVLCLFLCIFLCLSAGVCVAGAGHSCVDENCAVCMAYRAAQAVFKALGPANRLPGAVLRAGALSCLFLGVFCPRPVGVTLVGQKIKLTI